MEPVEPAPTSDGNLWDTPLRAAAERALAYLASVPGRPVGPPADRASLHRALGGPLPEQGSDPADVVTALADAAEPGLLTTQSPRFFGFVIGGAHPAALAADWLTSTWDQNAGLYVASPAAAVTEVVAAGWLLDLLGLPTESSVGFVTGGQMATWTCLAAARSRVLGDAGWDLERDGLQGAPLVRVFVGAQRHGTVDRSLRFLGFGSAAVTVVAVDEEGRMRAEALRAALAGAPPGPAIVVAQAGEVNSGAFDPFGEVCDAAAAHGAWVHVDGAFGLWAQASRRRRHLTAAVERADSWAVDAHKWLNVPYDSGLAIVRHPDAHRTAMMGGAAAAYLVYDDDARHDEMSWNPEHSRRARGLAIWAVLRALGRDGVADLVDGLCDRAARFAGAFAAADGVELLNEVVLNQVLVRFTGTAADDVLTRDVLQRVQQEGTCWVSGTAWQGRPAMRVSVSNHATTDADVDRSVAAVLHCAAQARA